MSEYRFDDSCQAITSFVYDKFCSWFIEVSKGKIAEQNTQRASVLKYTFRELVKLLHPFAPFVSEEIWSHLKTKDETLLISSSFPQKIQELDFSSDQKLMDRFIELVTNIRNLRSSVNLPPKEEISIALFGLDQSLLGYFKNNASSLYDLAKVKSVDTFSSNEPRPSKSIMKASVDHEVFVPLEGVIDLSEQVKRLEKDLLNRKRKFKN